MLFFDVEADDRLEDASRLWCICAYESDTGEWFQFGPDQITQGLDLLSNAGRLAAHNAYGFDLPVLAKLHGLVIERERVVDTLVLSRLAYPDLQGVDWVDPESGKRVYQTHSVGAWGRRLGSHKGDWTDFSKWDPEMLDYCTQDVAILVKLVEQIREEAPWALDERCHRIEHEFAGHIQDMMWRGAPFDTELAEEMAEEAGAAKAVLYTKLSQLHPGWQDRKVKKEKILPFNPTSRPQLARYLIEKYDWKPKHYTNSGAPQITEDILEGLPYAEGKELAELFRLAKLESSLSTGKQGWLKNVEDGRIHGTVIHNGTPTGRCRHSGPNLGNIPRKGEWLRCRSLFAVGDGRALVGADASSLELVILAHYLSYWDDGAYARVVSEGDVHSFNQKAVGLTSRDQAKTMIYACVPMDTRALTREGWKGYEDLEVGEEVLAYNEERGEQEWAPVLEKVYYDSAPVVEMRTNHSFCVRSTPNHRWFVRQRARSRKAQCGWKIGKDYMVPGVRTTDEINTESNVIVNVPLAFNSGDSCGPSPDIDLQKYGPNWTAIVCSMSSDERRAWLQGFLLADGHHNGRNWVFSQLEGDIFDAALTAAYLEFPGQIYVSSRTQGNGKVMKHVTISKRGHVTGQKLQKRYLEEQPVWCVRTKHESWVIRQGDTITITGNTLYGAGNSKLGRIVSSSDDERVLARAGRALRNKLTSALPALGSLLEAVKQAAENRGYLVGLDGRHVPIRSEHAALNFLCQAGGAVTMKQATNLANREYPGGMVLHVHDEMQFEVKEASAQKVGETVAECIRQAGRDMGLKCPLDAEFKVGKSWKETH